MHISGRKSVTAHTKAIAAANDYQMTRRNLLAASTVVISALSSRAVLAAGGCPGGGTGPPPVCCFLRGTHLQTPSGHVFVEALEIGDLVVTVSGAPKPIKWIGRVSVRRNSTGAWPKHAVPVKISPDAIKPGVPSVNVFVSPAHAVYIDNALIPVGNLINGTTIASDPDWGGEQLDYFHVELDGHNVVFAEGLPAETLLGGAGRMSFDNYLDYEALYPAQLLTAYPLYAPMLSLNGGRQELVSRLRSALSPWVDVRGPLDRVRDRLEVRAEEIEVF